MNKTPLITIDSSVNLTWCEKYRPKNETSWIGDRSIVDILVNFLKRPRTANRDPFDEDEDEVDLFESANALLLTGSHGWGKTCLVHALAQQENIKVLEMNSSSKRSGKVITSSLKEATQTHHLKLSNNKPINPGIARFFIKKPTPVQAESFEDVLYSSSNGGNKFDSQLILFDDVDVIYEGKNEDESKNADDCDVGFWRSVKQLIRETKVPVILTATNFKRNILNTRLNELNIIQLDLPKPDMSDIRNHLLKICSQEFTGISLSKLTSPENTDRLNELIITSDFDLRRCINELNFKGDTFFNPLKLPRVNFKSTDTTRKKKQRGRPAKKLRPNPEDELINSIRISDTIHLFSCENFDLTDLVLEDTCTILHPVSPTLSQRISQIQLRDKLFKAFKSTDDFINESFSHGKSSLLRTKVAQILDIIPYLSVICQVEANKRHDNNVPQERKKTRRLSRMQGLPYFEAIGSPSLDADCRTNLSSLYSSFNEYQLYDSDATDIDE